MSCLRVGTSGCADTVSAIPHRVEHFSTANIVIGAPNPRGDGLLHCVEGGLYPYLTLAPEFRRTGVDMLLMHRVTTHGEAAGFDACEASWILEDNRDMIGPLETMGFKTYRRYRIYRRTLA